MCLAKYNPASQHVELQSSLADRIELRMERWTLAGWLGIEIVEVSLVEKCVAAIGGGLAILLLISVSAYAVSGTDAITVIGSMGASAVLLFAVPHGQLSQPWPVIGGHVISAVIGVTCARAITNPTVAAMCAVGLSIGAMLQFKCIHPPGGATAFTAVLGGESIIDLGYAFVLFPVLVNALIMMLLACVLNGPFPWRRYPALLGRRPRANATLPTPEIRHQQILSAIRTLDSFVDITEDDLIYLADLLSKHP